MPQPDDIVPVPSPFGIMRASGIGVSDRWRRQYYKHDGWLDTDSGNSGDIHTALCALGPNPDVSAVDAIIGNNSWTRPLCHACGEKTDEAVLFPKWGDDSFAPVCFTCIRSAVASLDRALQ